MCLLMLLSFWTFITILPVTPTSNQPEPILIASNGPLETRAFNLIDEYFERLELPLNTNQKENDVSSHSAGITRASLFGLIQKINASLHQNDPEDSSSHYIGDIWSLIWYIGAFGGLVGFFMVVSCSECCCTIPPVIQTVSMSSAPRSTTIETPSLDQENTESSCMTNTLPPPVPPPPYSLFAPPDYESLFYIQETEKKNRVYIIPIHESTSRS